MWFTLPLILTLMKQASPFLQTALFKYLKGGGRVQHHKPFSEIWHGGKGVGRLTAICYSKITHTSALLLMSDFKNWVFILKQQRLWKHVKKLPSPYTFLNTDLPLSANASKIRCLRMVVFSTKRRTLTLLATNKCYLQTV